MRAFITASFRLVDRLKKTFSQTPHDVMRCKRHAKAYRHGGKIGVLLCKPLSIGKMWKSSFCHEAV
jgi:hypothetical protein